MFAEWSREYVKTIKTITGVVDVAFGLLFIGIAALVLTYLPGEWADYDREPEDLIFSGVYFVLSAFVGLTMWLSGVILYRDRGHFVISARLATWLLITGVVILSSLVVIGVTSSDAVPVNPERSASSHPRAFGTFPRVIAKYVNEDAILTLEDAIRRMTSMAARRLGLHDRGLIGTHNAACA